MTQPEREMKPNGATQSKLDVRYDLIPWDVVELWAQVFAEGIGRGYTEDNWKGLSPSDHENHMLNHLTKLKAGDTSEDHLGHFLWRAAAFVWARKHPEAWTEKPAAADVAAEIKREAAAAARRVYSQPQYIDKPGWSFTPADVDPEPKGNVTFGAAFDRLADHTFRAQQDSEPPASEIGRLLVERLSTLDADTKAFQITLQAGVDGRWAAAATSASTLTLPPKTFRLETAATPVEAMLKLLKAGAPVLE